MKKIIMLSFFAALFGFNKTQAQNTSKNTPATPTKVVKTAQEWKKVLTPNQYHILREKGTERAYSGEGWDNHEKGTYVCAGCNLPLFTSETKFESGTGWPSFFQPIAKNAVKEETDRTYGMARTEVLCSRCEGHLGHVFDDGPKPTGLRYCMNAGAMKFVKK
ncbi:MAG: peptide-methionine (R)-S-oxide reductase MsrB [Verrucomicrobia bacterium]|nr:peptide-methionine (R)-S-oxide reductase MsrB [Cytophagales bacterium]